jgi:non-homologous end joining protein Ku
VSDLKPPKAVGTVELSFFGGLANLQCSMVPVKKSEPGGLKIVCPDCEDTTKLEQRYLCPVDGQHGPFTAAEAARAIEVDRQLKRVTEDEAKALKEPTLPSGSAEFTAFPAHEVEAATMQSGATYRLRPKNAQRQYSALVDFLRDGKAEQALITELTYRDVQKMYRLIERDGMLVLVELVRPGELHPAENVTVEYQVELLDMFASAFEDQVEEFDPEAFASTTRDRVAALEASKRDPNAPVLAPAPKVAAKKTDDDDALMAALSARMGTKKATPAKRAAKKAV